MRLKNSRSGTNIYFEVLIEFVRRTYTYHSSCGLENKRCHYVTIG